MKTRPTDATVRTTKAVNGAGPPSPPQRKCGKCLLRRRRRNPRRRKVRSVPARYFSFSLPTLFFGVVHSRRFSSPSPLWGRDGELGCMCVCVRSKEDGREKNLFFTADGGANGSRVIFRFFRFGGERCAQRKKAAGRKGSRERPLFCDRIPRRNRRKGEKGRVFSVASCGRDISRRWTDRGGGQSGSKTVPFLGYVYGTPGQSIFAFVG